MTTYSKNQTSSNALLTHEMFTLLQKTCRTHYWKSGIKL